MRNTWAKRVPLLNKKWEAASSLAPLMGKSHFKYGRGVFSIHSVSRRASIGTALRGLVDEEGQAGINGSDRW